ncbi:Cof-type HAD-IIB family hydrolase [Lichenihabitans psoromatis]|uniref:Cof-type HAD-IIB family hydrolase n=1 Tax=Lichenihabitans psoromatis TaxID=2528642 RepID=UPI0013F1575D|nr:Cof-type HAD-IIB family hydrolase [Lichenihabitans psoromatis]
MSRDQHPRQPIALVVSDIDGTLVTKAKVVTPRARAAIAQLKERGIGFSVASARPPVGLRSIVQSIGIEVPVGAVNGGAIIRPDLTIIERLILPIDAVKTSVSMLRRQGIDAWLFTDDEWFCRDPNGAHVDHEATTLGLRPTIVEEFDDAHMSRTLKIVAASHDHPLLAECEAILQAELGGSALATRSQSYYLDITHAAANKGAAVRGVARNLGVPLDQVFTIGDGYNDTPMFDVSGFSVAMGNATDAVKHMANVVTDTCENEGFAKAIERYVLNMPVDAVAPSYEGSVQS